MNPERLALCTPKSINLYGTGGGIAEITAEDIAAALHKCSEYEYEVLSVKYMGGDPRKLHKKLIGHAILADVPIGNVEQIARLGFHH